MRIIAGPCQHETLELSLQIAKECKRVCDLHNIEYIFKASFDKANRSSMQGKRGVGLNTTLNDFKEIKSVVGCKTLTDVHTVEQISHIKTFFNDVVDVLQIPAFLCRQTDLIQAACATDKIVNIKKGQFLAPWDVKGILSKTDGAKEVWITERGTSFGYNTLVVDYTGLMYMLSNFDNDIVFDCTHSAQKPRGQGTSSGGTLTCPGLAPAGLFWDLPSPEVLSDDSQATVPNMLRLEDFEQVVGDIVKYQYERKI